MFPHLHDELDDVTPSAAAEAVVRPSGLVHGEGRVAVVVERAAANHASSGRLHFDVSVVYQGHDRAFDGRR